MQSVQLDHVHVAVSDLHRAVDFYTEQLGFTLGYRDDKMAEFEEVLVLDQEIAGQTAATVAFRIDDVDGYYARLTEKGVAVEEAPQDQSWGVRNFYVRDPDGNLLEFLQSLAEQVPADAE